MLQDLDEDTVNTVEPRHGPASRRKKHRARLDAVELTDGEDYEFD